MKTRCKHTHVGSQWFMREAIDHYLKGKRNRHDVKRWLERNPGLDAAALRLAEGIQTGRIRFQPIRYFNRVEPISGKHRVIGRESVEQQICDHAAVIALQPLIKARLGRWQTATIKGRGIIDSKRAIERWLHDKRSRYFAKLDVIHYYPSIDRPTLMRMLDHDIGDATLLRLIWILISTHRGTNGLNIGSYLSQTLGNYYLAGAYHYALGEWKPRRGKRVRLASHVLFYMDDMMLLGRDKRDVRMCAHRLESYLDQMLHLKVHEGWDVGRVGADQLDMVGFRFTPNRTTLRPELFLRARRAFKRADKSMCRTRALRCSSYYGWLKNSDNIRFRRRNHIDRIQRRASRMLSKRKERKQ
ncbi:RNA-directed DNA polymerase [Bifidobacterium oedipodis]|nr:RNA-directed DNA polymerase [Bifidobacterium sp. DSM 109957]